VAVLSRYAAESRALNAGQIVCVATSATRDASNGAEFFEAARRAAGLTPTVISGDEEARLVWRSAWRDFGAPAGSSGPLAVLDVGGGSTELSFGDGPTPSGRTSLQVGAVRLTERHVREDPLGPATVAALRAAARSALAPLASLPGVEGVRRGRLVGVAGTVTTLSAVAQALPVYDAERVHGSTLRRDEVEGLIARLAALPLAARAGLPGMEPKRADVIVAGAVVVAEALDLLGLDRLVVSDRGVRWGLAYERLGA
jgi:exopolyphosphatase / guanosine-5'-triphosphate,3'-diphosphate pyrophosphatase